MIIYKATNTINGMSYIGQTIFTIDERRLKHERLDDKSYFQNAIESHGKDVFEWEILYECSTPEELSEKEMFYVEHFNTLRPNGYNLTKGGEGSFWTGDNNPAKMDWVRQKISDKAKGRKREDLSERNKSNSGKTYEEIYGEERAGEIKTLKSKQRTGKPGARWTDEMKQRSVKSKAKYRYILKDPNNNIFEELSTREISRKHDLSRSSVRLMIKDGISVKGWTVTRELI